MTQGCLRLLLALSLSTACADDVSRAAKARIFSPEDPPQAVAAASEKLDAEALAKDRSIARRIVTMGAAEVTERIGAHRYSAAVSFEWRAGDAELKLVETRTLVAGPGGVNGDFHAVLDNSRDQGLEVLRVDGRVFARSRHGQFRERRRDRGMAERKREETYAALSDLEQLFGGRVALENTGAVTYQGRSGWAYKVLLAAFTEDQDRQLPPRLAPKGGLDEGTRRRLRFFETRLPKTLSGELVVDAKTGVVLKAKIDGRLEVPGREGSATLSLLIDTTLSDIGKVPPLTVPTKFLPDEDKPSGIAAALDRFGIPRAGRADAGTVEVPDEDA